MTLNIHKHFLAILLAGAMILFLGVALQPVYADDEAGDYEVYFETDNTAGCALPGGSMELTAILTQDGQPAELPDGAACEWRASVMPGPDYSSEDLKDFVTITKDASDPMKATISFGELPDRINDVIVGVTVKVVKDGATLCESDTGQLGVQNDFYEVVFPDLDPFMPVGEKKTENVKVIHHYIDSNGLASKPCKVSFKWSGKHPSLEIGSPVHKDDGSYDITFKRKSSDNEDDFALTMTYDGKSDKMNYWMAEFSTDLGFCDVQVRDTKYNYTFEELVCYVDEVAAKKAGAVLGVSLDDLVIVSGELEKPYDPALFEVEAKKLVGYDEDNPNKPIYEKTSFPLTIDPPGTKDRNGNRTDGAGVYSFIVKAKSGSGWTGKTIEMMLCVYSKYSFYAFGDNLGGFANFPNLEKYLEWMSEPPFVRYEVPKGVTDKLDISIGKDKLTPGKEVDASYVNDKTKEAVDSFPETPGEYTLVLKGKDPYYGESEDLHLKVGLANTLAVKGLTMKVKAKKKVKKTKTYDISKVIKVTDPQGPVKYKKVKGNKKIVVSSTGKVKVKKGLKKGTYKVKVKVTAEGTDEYFPASKTVTFKIKIKKK